MNIEVFLFAHLLSLFLALVLDTLLGEPKRYHPLVAYGSLVNYLSAEFNISASNKVKLLMGGLAWGIAVIPLTAIVAYLHYILVVQHEYITAIIFLESVILYCCIARKSLHQHVLAVYRPLSRGEVDKARQAVGLIVSRDTASLDKRGIRSAAIESALENGADGIFAPIFWFLLLGAPAALCYRLVNTLDAMWGYRNDKFFYFGRVAARADDLMNWFPARLVAFSYSMLGSHRSGMQAWRDQAHKCASPNAGPVMAAGAGALQIEVGGNAIYHGNLEQRPVLGIGAKPSDEDIVRSLQLVDKTLILWLVLSALCTALFFFFWKIYG